MPSKEQRSVYTLKTKAGFVIEKALARFEVLEEDVGDGGSRTGLEDTKLRTGGENTTHQVCRQLCATK